MGRRRSNVKIKAELPIALAELPLALASGEHGAM
jgi:hypothetical protein